MPTTTEWVDAVRDAEAWVEAARLVRERYRRTVSAILVCEGNDVSDVASMLGVDEQLAGHPHAPVETDDILWTRGSLLHEFVNPERRSA